jgi:ATP-dependent protease ClpP protease subunit
MVLELSLKGQIGEGLGISLESVREKIAAAAGTFDAIEFAISSNGGDFDQALALFTMFRSLPFPVAATATGDVFSGALLVFMSAGLRKAKASAQFLIHPSSRGRDQLPERVTAEILQKQADELAKIDERAVDLFAYRTGFDRAFFESEKSTEEILDTAMAIESGIAHEFEDFTPRCNPAWPENMRRLEKETGCIFPAWMTTASYMEACRCAAFFEDKKADVDIINVKDERGAHAPHVPAAVDAVPATAPPRLTVIAS